MSAVRAFQNAFKTMDRKGWDKIFVAVDIHETMMEPTWSEERSHQFYKYCLPVMQYLSKRSDICLILWSSSSPENNKIYQKEFAELGMDFKYINSNPEVKSTHYADFDSKFYVNVILDDKAGFSPEEEWLELMIAFGITNDN